MSIKQENTTQASIEDWEKDESPYRTALAHAITFPITALIERKDDITDELIRARDAVDKEVRSLLATERKKEREMLVEKLEGMKINEKGTIKLEYADGTTHEMSANTDRALAYNQGIDAAIATLKAQE